MLVDEVQITIQAGKGGDGRVSFHREKFVPKGGPDGGDGGNGGNVYLTSTDDIGALNKFRFQKEFKAEDGKPGGAGRKTGMSGKDLEIMVPVGTVIDDTEGVASWEIKTKDDRVLLAQGGKGGRGNWHFKSATHQTPTEFEYGTLGQQRNLFLELRLIADIGLIGLPSVGKSALLNELTRASAKVAPYPFTTLEPNLGSMNGLILADLPGLIEGAHKGKGLGVKFLKHIKRTKVLVHCISAESSDVLRDYGIVRKELGKYDKELLARPEIILLTKSDLVTKEQLKDIKTRLRSAELSSASFGEAREILACSIYDYEGIENLKRKLHNILKTQN